MLNGQEIRCIVTAIPQEKNWAEKEFCRLELIVASSKLQYRGRSFRPIKGNSCNEQIIVQASIIRLIGGNFRDEQIMP